MPAANGDGRVLRENWNVLIVSRRDPESGEAVQAITAMSAERNGKLP